MTLADMSALISLIATLVIGAGVVWYRAKYGPSCPHRTEGCDGEGAPLCRACVADVEAMEEMLP